MPIVPVRDTLIVAILALVADALFGYPDRLYRRVGHPVSWIGRMIGRLDRTLNRDSLPQRRRRLNGVLALAAIAGLPTLLAWLVQHLCRTALPRPVGLAALGLLAGTLSAQRSLLAHVDAVRRGLSERGLAGGRAAVAMIVGRDPQSLDEAGVARAAIESLAENFSDGVVAPLLWCAVLGLPGMAFYKAVNTADSMIGHLTPRHASFGWAAARLDDWINLPASRLSALLIAAACLPGRRTSLRAAWAAVRRDARGHRSPNAGWPEAAMAGGLGLRLAGPRSYAGRRIEDRWMGDGREAATHRDIGQAMRRVVIACVIQAGMLIAIAATP